MVEDTARGEPAKHTADAAEDLVAVLSQKVVGQPAAMSVIVPYIEMHRANLAPEGRPVGNFLLLGPTGTGKTRTVEALAEILHGNKKKVLKINCGEYQLDHEVAKLIGAPPGYVGHRESQPALTQAQLSEVTSERSDLSLVLFDEIEKAAPSLTRILLGVLDQATLQLGDNTTVNFEKSLIFLTSNLGAREMMREFVPGLGFQPGAAREKRELTSKLQNIALAAVRKMFSPEFVNRLDAVITYQPLDADSLSAILDQHIADLRSHVQTRLGSRCFQIEVTPAARDYLLQKGTSTEYGARELKRTIHRHLTQPLATLVAAGRVASGGCVQVDARPGAEQLVLNTQDPPHVSISAPHSVLIVDDNKDLADFLKQWMETLGWRVKSAPAVQHALEIIAADPPNTALLDYLLPDGTGLELAIQIRMMAPQIQIILMTGGVLPPEEEIVCRQFGFPILHKPFLPADLSSLIRQPSVRLSAIAG